MFGEFEDAEDAQNTHEDEGAAAPSALTVALCLLHGQDDEVRHDSHQVEQIHGVLDELQLGRTRCDAQQELSAEPDDAHLQPQTIRYDTI